MVRSISSLLLPFVISASAFAASADAGLLALLPSDAQTIASMNVDSSRSSNFGQFMLRQMSVNDKSFQDLIEQTGFDPRRDLQTFIVADLPSTTKSSSRFVVLARGIFDQSRIAANATAKGMTSQSIGGTTVMLSSDGNRKMALAFPETGIAVLGDQASVEQVLKNRANPSTLPAGLQAQISAASANNDAWFASIVPANDFVSQVPQVSGSPQAAQAMQAVVQSNGGIRFGSSIQLSFNALTRSAKDATSLTDVIRFVSSLIQMQRTNDPRAAVLAPAMDSLQLRADGREVYTSLTIPEADLEQLITSQPKAPKRTH